MSTTKKKDGFSAEEKAAMRARAKELKVAEDGATAIKSAFAEMTPAERKIGERIHKLVKENAPDLTPKTWYGMPAYANRDGKVVCFYRNAGKFKERYGMFGFNEAANLDKGAVWPIAYAITELTGADEVALGKLIKKAVS
jgi:uncharacterized protein YdhG (YjbR/CyaY superfamily)